MSKLFETTKSGIAVYTEGTGDPLIVVGGGPGASSRIYRNHLLPLAQYFTCYFWDFRGTGNSPKSSQYSCQQDLEDLHSVIEHIHLNGAEPSLLAHSYGGVAALGYASKFPVAKLILMGASAAIGQVAPQLFDRKIARLGERLGAELSNLLTKASCSYLSASELRRFLELDGTSHMSNPSAHLVEVFANEFELNLQVMFANTDWLESDFTSHLKDINAKTLLICGENDIVVPMEFSRGLQQNIRDINTIVFENCGHWPFLEQKDKFWNVLAGYLS